LRKTIKRVHDVASCSHDPRPIYVSLVIAQSHLISHLLALALYARSQIELKAEDLYDKEKVDLETVQIDDVFTLLQCDDQGLTGEEAARRLAIFRSQQARI
jgi:hypothetical protein